MSEYNRINAPSEVLDLEKELVEIEEQIVIICRKSISTMGVVNVARVGAEAIDRVRRMRDELYPSLATTKQLKFIEDLCDRQGVENDFDSKTGTRKAAKRLIDKLLAY